LSVVASNRNSCSRKLVTLWRDREKVDVVLAILSVVLVFIAHIVDRAAGLAAIARLCCASRLARSFWLVCSSWRSTFFGKVVGFATFWTCFARSRTCRVRGVLVATFAATLVVNRAVCEAYLFASRLLWVWNRVYKPSSGAFLDFGNLRACNRPNSSPVEKSS